jgi:hypothetical protein
VACVSARYVPEKILADQTQVICRILTTQQLLRAFISSL